MTLVNLGQGGFLYSLQRGVQRVTASRYIRVGWVTLWELPLAGEYGPPIPTRHETRWATPADIDAFAAFGHLPHAHAARFERGERGRALFREGAIVAYVWFRDDVVPLDDDFRVHLWPGDIWLADAKVLPGHRRQGLYGELLIAALCELEDQGFRRVLLAVDRFNRESSRAHARYGARPAGSMLSIRAGETVIVRESVTLDATSSRARRRWIKRRRPVEIEPRRPEPPERYPESSSNRP